MTPTPKAPDSAPQIFGARLDLAEHFVAILADTGIRHGLIGPGEAPRLWDRHLLNCAVVHRAFPAGAHVADVGSGAGLPGLALAIVRPDLHLELIEPLQRRTDWLRKTVQALGVENVTVHQARAAALWGELRVPHVTARAVAGLGLLARWSLPLLSAGGSLHALKGNRAVQELSESRRELGRLGATGVSVHTYGHGLVDPPTVVVQVDIDTVVPPGGVAPNVPSRANARRPGSGTSA